MPTLVKEFDLLRELLNAFSNYKKGRPDLKVVEGLHHLHRVCLVRTVVEGQGADLDWVTGGAELLVDLDPAARYEVGEVEGCLRGAGQQ